MNDLVCEICKFVCKDYHKLANHIRKHNITSKYYFNKYLLNDKNKIKCEVCGKEPKFLGMKKGYSTHCSIKCGVSNPKTIEKAKKKFILKYGVCNPSQSISIKEKKAKTCLKNYGVENPSKSEIVRHKVKQTCFKNNGVLYPMQNTDIHNKAKQTCFKHYGVEFSFQSLEIKKRTVKSNLIKYGFISTNQVSYIKDKQKKTCFKNYGVENPRQSEEIKRKYRQTCLKRYGVDHPNKTKKSRENLRQVMLNGGAVVALHGNKSPSKPQVKLYYMIKSLYEDAVLNFPVIEVNKSIDIAIPTLKVAIEYAGSYWHQNKEKDQIRQKEIENLGWRFIRYLDEIPSLERIKEDISLLDKES